MFGSTNVPGAYQSIAWAASGDGVFGGTNAANGTAITKSTAWGIRGAYTHNWSPTWSSSLFGSYTQLRWGATGGALICGGLGASGIIFSNGAAGCNPDFNIAQVGFVTRWTPVKNLTFSGEVLWTALDQKNSGLISPAGAAPVNNNLVGATKPGGVTYELKDQNTVTFGVRAQRVF